MPLTGFVEFTATFVDASTPADAITYWLWDFGDGSAYYEGQTPPPHLYDTPGVYTVTLHVASAKGIDTFSDTVTVTEFPDPIYSWAFEDAVLPALDAVGGLQVEALSAGQGIAPAGYINKAVENTDNTAAGGLILSAPQNVVPSSGAYSFSFWFKPAAIDALDAILWEGVTSVVAGNTRFMLRVNAAGDGIEYRISNGATFATDMDLAVTLNPALWYWVYVTASATGTVLFGIKSEDGSVDEIATAAGATNPANIGGTSLYLFTAPAYVKILTGKMDALKFWDVELSAAELDYEYERTT